MVTAISILTAKLFSLAFVSVSLGAILGNIQYKKVMDDVSKNSGLVMLFGFLSLIVGALLVFSHNVWESSWAVLITLIGWIGLIKGVSILVFPKWVMDTSKSMFKGGMAPVMPYFQLALGLVLGYFGFFA